jgi:hypothetical protein
MNRFISGNEGREATRREMLLRRAIIQSGYAFIVLELIDDTKKRVSGIEELIPIPTEKRGKYNFKTESRHLVFSPDMNYGGLYTAYVLDTEFNRKFLASHLNEGYWDVIQVIPGKNNSLNLGTLISELHDLKEKQIQATIKANKGKEMPILNRVKYSFDVGGLSDEDLAREMERRKNLKASSIEALAKTDEANQSKESAKTQEFVVDINITPEEFNKLTPGQKGKVTKARNLAKKNEKLARKNKKVLDLPKGVNEVNETDKDMPLSSVLSESEFLRKPVGVGVVKP